jgi:hypothetical protein
MLNIYQINVSVENYVEKNYQTRTINSKLFTNHFLVFKVKGNLGILKLY